LTLNASVTLKEPTDPSPLGSHPKGADAALDKALQQLTSQRQQRLSALIDESRRCEELSTALPADAVEPVQQRKRALDDEILDLLAGWQALGGTVVLAPPIGPIEETAEPAAAAPLTSPTPEQDACVEAGESASPRPPEPQAPIPPRPRGIPIHAPQAPQPPQPTGPAPDWDQDLAALLLELRPRSDAQLEMDAIQHGASASFRRWIHYPRSVQRALVGNLACRLRTLQDDLGMIGPKLDSAFRSLTRFSKSFQPGWVNGLTRGRGPAAASWAAEARVWWDQLYLSAQRAGDASADEVDSREDAIDSVQSWLGEWREAPDVAKPMCLDKTLAAIQAALDTGVPHTDPQLCRLADEIYDHLETSRFRRLRQGIRDLELAAREDQDLEQVEAVPTEWPWWSHTVGRRALVLGGEMEADRVIQVERSFGLAELRCEPLETELDDDALRVLLGGGIDLVMLVGEHAGRPQVRAAIRGCQVRGLPWIHMDHTLGVTRVRMAIERFLQPDPRNEGNKP
jgi:hypothetical protein